MEENYKLKYQMISKAIRELHEVATNHHEKEDNPLAEYDEGFYDAMQTILGLLNDYDEVIK